MDTFFRRLKPDWLHKLDVSGKAAKAASTMRNKQKKRDEVMSILEDLEKMLKKCMKLCEEYVNEMWDLLDAAKPEEGLPPAKVPQRGLANSEVDKHILVAQEQVNKFLKERRAILDVEQRNEDTKAQTLKLLYGAEIGGELRGYNWLQKQITKAAREGKAPPAAAVTLNAITKDLLAHGQTAKKTAKEDVDARRASIGSAEVLEAAGSRDSSKGSGPGSPGGAGSRVSISMGSNLASSIGTSNLASGSPTGRRRSVFGARDITSSGRVPSRHGHEDEDEDDSPVQKGPSEPPSTAGPNEPL